MADADDAAFSNSASDFRCDSPTGSHTSSGVSDGGGGRIALTSSINQCNYGAGGGSFTDIGAGGQWSSLSRCGEGFRGSSSSLASVCSSASQFASQQPRRESVVEAIEKKRRENVSARLRNQLQLMQQRSMSVDVAADGPVSVADQPDAPPQLVEMPVIAAMPRRSRDTVLPRQPRRNSAYQPIVGGMAFATGRSEIDSASDVSSSAMSGLRRHSLTSSGVLETLRGGRRSLSVFDDGVRSDEPPISSMLMTSSLTSPRFRDTLSGTTFPNKGNNSDEYQSAATSPQLDFNDVPDKRVALSAHNDGRFVSGKILTTSASDDASLDSSRSSPCRNKLGSSRYRHGDSKYDQSPAGDELVASGDDESVSSFTFLSGPPDYKPEMPPDDATVVSAHSELLRSPCQRPQRKLNEDDVTKAKADTPSSYGSIQSQPVLKAAARPKLNVNKSEEAISCQVRLGHPPQKNLPMNEVLSSGTTTSTVERVDDVIRVSSARPRLQRPSSQPTPSDVSPTYRNQNSVDVAANRESPLSICSQRPPVMPKSSIYRSAVSLNISTPLSPPVKTGNAALASARQQRQTGPPPAVRRSSASGRLVSTDTPVLPYRRTDHTPTTTSDPSSSAEDASAVRQNGGGNSVAAISAMFEQSRSRPTAEYALSRSASAPEKASEVVRKKDDGTKETLSVGDDVVVVAAQPPPLPTSAQPSDVVIAAAKVMQQLNTWENDIDRDMGRKTGTEVDFNLRFPGRPRSLRLDQNSADQLSAMRVIGPEPMNAPLPPPSPSKMSALSITMNAPSSPSTRPSLSSPPIAQFDDASDLDLYPLLPCTSPPPAEIPAAALTTPPMATPSPPLPSSTVPVGLKHQKMSVSRPQQSTLVNEETSYSITAATVDDDHKSDHCQKPAEFVHDTTPLSPTLREFSMTNTGRGRQQSFDEAFKYGGNGNLGSETDVLFSRMNRNGNRDGAVLSSSSQRSRPISAGFSASSSQASPTRASISAAAVARGLGRNDVRDNRTTGTTSVPVNDGHMAVPTVVRPTSAVEKSMTTPSVQTERKGSREELHIVPVVVTSEVSRRAKGCRTVTDETTVAENNHKDPGNSDSDEDSHVQPVSRTIRKMQLQIAAANSSIRPEVSRRPAPAPTRTTSWTNVTSNTEFVFAPTKSVTPSTHADHVTSASVVTTSKLAVYSPEVAESDDERATRARRTDAVERSWESCMGPGNSRSAVRVLPRAGNQPAPSASGPSNTFVAQNVRRDSNSKSADVGDPDAITVIPIVRRDRKRPVLVPVTVQHETTIPVKATTVSADQIVRGKSLTSLSTDVTATSNGDTCSDELSNMHHGSSMPNMADQNGLSGEKSGTRECCIPISVVNGRHSSKDNGIDRRPEVFKISNAVPVNDADEDTFEINVLKSGLGLSFCIEGGVGSANGDQPIIVKRVFRAGEQLRPGDELLTANGRSLSLLSHYVAWNYLKSLPEGIITLVVRRRRQDGVDLTSPMTSPTTTDVCLTRIMAGQRVTGIEIAAS